MRSSRRSAVRLSVVSRKEVVEDMSRVRKQVCWKGRPVFGKEGSNRLKGPQGFFPCGKPDFDLLFAVVKTSVQSCIPSADSVLQCPHQSDGTAFSL